MDQRFRRDIVWNLVPVALLGVVGLGLNFAIGAWWGAAALGVFNQVTPALFVLAVLGAGGLQFAVLRATAAEPGSRLGAVVVGALVPSVVLACAATALFVALRHPIADLLDSPPVASGIAWAAPGLFCFAINKVLLGVVNGLRRMRAFAVYTSLRYTLIAAGLGIAKVHGATAEQLPGIWSFAEGVLLLVLLGELIATVPVMRCAGWRQEAREHLSYGARSVVATALFEINAKLDVWMLGIALSDRDVGVYSLASALAEGVLQLAVVVQNNVNPVVARSLSAGDTAEVARLVGRTRRWFVPGLAGICAVSAAVFPTAVPWLIGDPVFRAGALPFAVLVGGIALASPYLAFAQLLLMASRPGWHTVYMALVVALNFVAALVLIPSLGALGAAVATAASIVWSAALLRFMAHAKTGVVL